jgi:hypothetical protein
MTTLLFISSHDRHWDAQVALRRPDLVFEESDRVERMTERFWELTSAEYGPLGTTPTDRVRVLRHLIAEATRESAMEQDSTTVAEQALAEQLGSEGSWSAAQAARLAALMDTHAGVLPTLARVEDGTVLVGFGPRRRGGVFSVDPSGRAAWTELAASSGELRAA